MEEHYRIFMDIEGIRVSKTHICIRKLAMVNINNTKERLVIEGYPCKKFDDIEGKYQRSFIHCFKKIHSLCYYPQGKHVLCSQISDDLRRRFNVGKCHFYYKGGQLEKDFLTTLDVKGTDIERFACPRYDILKTWYGINDEFHDPTLECLAFIRWMTENSCS